MMKTGAHVVTVAVLLGFSWGCGGSTPKPRAVSKADKAAIASSPDGLIEKAGEELSGLVTAADVAGIEQMWLTPERLAGCTVTGKEVAEAEMTSFPEKQLQRLRSKASNFEEGASLLHVNTWTEAEAKYLGGTLSGDGCEARAFGRINVIVKLGGDEPKVIEHRFNAQLIGEQWYLYRYLPFTPDCSKPKDAKELGCRKLKGG